MNLTQKQAIKSSANAMGLTGKDREQYEQNPTKWLEDNDLLDYCTGETRCLLDGTADKIGKNVFNTFIIGGLLISLISGIIYFINPIPYQDSCSAAFIIIGLVSAFVGTTFRLMFGFR